MQFIKINFLVLILPFLCLAQSSDTTGSYIKFSKVYETYKDIRSTELENVPDSTFRSVIKIIYNGVENTPALKPNFNIIKFIEVKHSSFLASIVTIPVLVKAKVISSRIVTIDGWGQINLLLEPEYIIKGKPDFLKDKNFEVYYRNYELVPDSMDYKTGKSYLFPLWDRDEPDNEILAIATWMDKHGSRFLVEDGLLNDRWHFFSKESKMSWDNFMSLMDDVIYKINNELPLDEYKNPVKHNRPKEN